MRELPLCSINVGMSSEDLEDMLAALHPYVVKNKQGFILTVNDYDDDSRELYEIPEVIDLFDRAMNVGFFSLLEVTTSLDTDSNPFRNTRAPGLGAFECYLIARNEMQFLVKEGVDSKKFDEFVEFLYNESNTNAEQSLKKSKDRGVNSNDAVNSFVMDSDGNFEERDMTSVLGKQPQGQQKLNPRKHKWMK